MVLPLTQVGLTLGILFEIDKSGDLTNVFHVHHSNFNLQGDLSQRMHLSSTTQGTLSQLQIKQIKSAINDEKFNKANVARATSLLEIDDA